MTYEDFVIGRMRLKPDDNRLESLFRDKEKMKRLFEARKNELLEEDAKEKELLLIESLDYYVAKEMAKNDLTRHEKKNIYTYLSFLNKEIKDNPYILFSNPIFRKVKEEKLKTYFSTEQYKEYEQITLKLVKRNEDIYKTFKNNPIRLMKKDIDELTTFLTHTIGSSNPAAKKMQKSFFQTLLIENTTLDLKAQNFLLRYLGHKEMKDTNLFWSLSFINVDEDHMAEYIDQKIRINKKVMIKGIDATTLVKIFYHELRHLEQDRRGIEGSKEDFAMYYAAQVLTSFTENGKSEYLTYYDTHEIEVDSNIAALEKTINILQENLPKKKFIERLNTISYDKHRELLKRVNSYREYQTTKEPVFKSNERNLNRIFNETPVYLNVYPQFKDYYHDDGTSKTVVETLVNPVVNNKSKFFYDMISAKRLKEPFDDIELDGLTQREIVIFMNNLSQYAYIAAQRVSSTSKVLSDLHKNKKGHALNVDEQVMSANIESHSDSLEYASNLLQKMTNKNNDYTCTNARAAISHVDRSAQILEMSMSSIDRTNPSFLNFIATKHRPVANYLKRKEDENDRQGSFNNRNR